MHYFTFNYRYGDAMLKKDFAEDSFGCLPLKKTKHKFNLKATKIG